MAPAGHGTAASAAVPTKRGAHQAVGPVHGGTVEADRRSGSGTRSPERPSARMSSLTGVSADKGHPTRSGSPPNGAERAAEASADQAIGLLWHSKKAAS
jgi:hypothetical protein